LAVGEQRSPDTLASSRLGRKETPERKEGESEGEREGRGKGEEKRVRGSCPTFPKVPTPPINTDSDAIH